jgi:hypothetical protein
MDFSEAAYQVINGDMDQESETVNDNRLDNLIQKDDSPHNTKASVGIYTNKYIYIYIYTYIYIYIYIHINIYYIYIYIHIYIYI